MSADLIQRLRTRPTGDPYLHMMVHEAADELERLTAELAATRVDAERMALAINDLMRAHMLKPSCQAGVAVRCMCKECATKRALAAIDAARQAG